MNKALTGLTLTYRGLILNIEELRGSQLAAYFGAQSSTDFTQMGNAPGLCPSLLGAPSNTAEMQQQFHTHRSPARLHQVIPSNSALPNHALSSGSALELLLEERNPSRGSAKLLGSEQLWDVVGKLELHRVTKGRLRASHCSSQFPEAVRAYRTGTARLRRMQGKETATICKQNSDWIEWKKFFTVKTIKPWN